MKVFVIQDPDKLIETVHLSEDAAENAKSALRANLAARVDFMITEHLVDIISDITSMMNNLEKGKQLVIEDLSIKNVNKVLTVLLLKAIDVREDLNGHDLDWSVGPFKVKEDYYTAWGSGYMGSLCILKLKTDTSIISDSSGSLS